MNRHFFHRLIAAVCVLMTCFHAVAGGLLVECRESDGTSHLEFGGCGQDESGRCDEACAPQQAEDPDPGAPGQCEDRPVKTAVGTATVRPPHSAVAFVLPLPTLAAIAFSIDPLPPRVLVRRIEVRAAAPPPEMVSIRTVVILV